MDTKGNISIFKNIIESPQNIEPINPDYEMIKHCKKFYLIGTEKEKFIHLIDIHSLKTIHTFEYQSKIRYLGLRKENQFLVLGQDKVDLITFEHECFIDDNIEGFDENYDDFDFGYTKEKKYDLTPTPITSGARFNYSGDLVYFSSGEENNAKTYQEFLSYSVKNDGYQGSDYFSNFFIEEEKKEENVNTINTKLQFFEFQNLIGFDKKLAIELNFDPKHNIEVLEKYNMKNDIKFWKIIQILNLNKKTRFDIFDQTLNTM